jgi:predicted transcriptional regulator
METVMKELRTKGFWPELTYETVSTLVTHLGLKGYDPCYLSEVFEN